jgi:hypothetical protein
VIVGCVLYLLPWVVAAMRGKKNSGAILALNVLLGWTVIGWIIAFIWALTTSPVDVKPQ